MGSVVKQFSVRCSPAAAWDAICDIGALHTRLAPGFVVDTRREPGARWVTFANGAQVREPIVTIDGERRRLVWSAQGGRATHYNASAQVFEASAGALIVWIADFLPDEIAAAIDGVMTAGAQAMKQTLDALEP